MLTNPVLVSVIFMCVLCLFKVNILVAILLSAMVAALLGGMPITGSDGFMNVLIGGMGGNAETALSYILLGALAYGIQGTGVADMLSNKLQKVFGKKGPIFLLSLAAIACTSQNLIPIHIAFIPILIPPLLGMMNEMKLDRRGVACALTFGLKTPYIMIPAGFGIIFHGILADQMIANGVHFDKMEVWKTLFLPGCGMILGLLIAVFISFRKPREYETVNIAAGLDSAVGETSPETVVFGRKHTGALVGALAAFVIQILTGSLPLGALCALIVMIAFGSIKFKDFDKTINSGIAMMGFIAFVMMVAAGYGNVIRETGGVETLVAATAELFGESKIIAASVILLIGLIVTMGIGTSFGTIPILATIFVPLCATLGFSPAATMCLMGTAAALGDAGSPASDSTLGPTAGLNVDGQHDHIWDTCVPTFLHYNIPLLIFGLAASLIL